MSERSEEPTGESPLFYLERTFVVTEGTAKERAEAILRERLEESKTEAAERAPGKFMNFAAFDHYWTDRPKRPPLVMLQWKDWRGAPEVSYPLADKLAARAARKSAASIPPANSDTPGASAPPPAASAPPPAASAAPPAADAPPPAATAAEGMPAPVPSPGATPQPQPQAQPLARTKRTSTDEHDARLAHAFEATQDLFFLSTPAEGLDFAVRLLDELVPCEACSACLYDINTDEFRFVVLTGPGGEERKGEAIPSRTGILGAAAERVGAPSVVADVGSDARFDPGVDGRVGLELKDALYMAIHHQGRLLGILQLANRRDPGGFSANDGEVVSYIAKQLAEFLYQARIAPDQGARI